MSLYFKEIAFVASFKRGQLISTSCGVCSGRIWNLDLSHTMIYKGEGWNEEYCVGINFGYFRCVLVVSLVILIDRSRILAEFSWVREKRPVLQERYVGCKHCRKSKHYYRVPAVFLPTGQYLPIFYNVNISIFYSDIHFNYSLHFSTTNTNISTKIIHDSNLFYYHNPFQLFLFSSFCLSISKFIHQFFIIAFVKFARLC